MSFKQMHLCNLIASRFFSGSTWSGSGWWPKVFTEHADAPRNELDLFYGQARYRVDVKNDEIASRRKDAQLMIYYQIMTCEAFVSRKVQDLEN